MNSLKGLGVFVLLAGIALAVSLAGRVQLIVFTVTVGLIAASVFTFAASRKRYRKDHRIAGGFDMTQIIPARLLRPTSHRRGRTLLIPLVLVAVAVPGAAYAVWRIAPLGSGASTGTPSVPLTIRYRTDTPSTAPVGRPWFEIINNSTKTVQLRDVKLRYYFAADQASAYGANCFETALRCSNVTETIEALASPIPKANHYLQIGFTSDAGILASQQTSGGIGLQLYRLDHKELHQTNDHSFDPKAAQYMPSRLVTAYVGGELSWGEEPTSQALAATASVAPVPTADKPVPGVLFDNFHYTGPDDPALEAGGWHVRTERGRPGIPDTWSADMVSFPADPTAQGGQALQLAASTDGTKQGTKQAEVLTASNVFFTGTLAARVFFADRPVAGRNGDHIVEAFSAISSSPSSPNYSELDYEYQPNGGWGAAGPKLDTTSWRSSKDGDRVTQAHNKRLAGWHVLMLTAANGVVTYSIDGNKVFSSDGAAYPRERMGIHFSTWFIDLPMTEKRTWSMRVNWVFKADQAMSLTDVQNAVNGFYANGINRKQANTTP
ncbi:cellulose binding domain-containing protein [Dactylosporangium sp. NPDC000555]|uniref:cellulose binding domain-containing protein n=1 Tax=Dactylosporangium sp. NPDC000555 TaxID=3154260 RepID=UPI00331687B0